MYTAPKVLRALRLKISNAFLKRPRLSGAFWIKLALELEMWNNAGDSDPLYLIGRDYGESLRFINFNSFLHTLLATGEEYFLFETKLENFVWLIYI